MRKTIVGALALIAASAVHAGEFQYDCTVGAARAVDDAKLPASRWGPGLPGQRFTISRETGAIGGSTAFRLDKGPDWRTVQVLDPGSSRQSFKLLAISAGASSKVIYVEVKEDEPGTAKPFMYYGDWKVTIGTCR